MFTLSTICYFVNAEKRRYWILRAAIPFTNLHQGARVRVLQTFFNGSVKLTTGDSVPEYLLDEELSVICGAL